MKDIPKKKRKYCAKCGDALSLVYKYARTEEVETLDDGMKVRHFHLKWTGEFGNNGFNFARSQSSFCDVFCATKYAEKKALEAD